MGGEVCHEGIEGHIELTSILITGASGFVGRKIAESLARSKRDITLYALLRDPDKGKGMADCGIHIYKGDILNTETLKEPLSGKDMVIHCAALMSNFDMESKKRFYDVNVRGTQNLLAVCDPKRPRRFIHISTAGVYGPTGKKTVGEDAPYGKKLSTYEWSKVEAEKALLEHAKNRGLEFIILRLSQMYGPGMVYGWPETINAIRTGSMAIPGRGKAKIHLLNIYDLIEAVKLAVAVKEGVNEIYNIAGPEISELAEVFDIIARVLGTKSPKRVPYLPVYLLSLLLSLVPYRIKGKKLRLLTPHRVRFFVTDHAYDISKARDLLGYRPSVSLNEGFSRMIGWYKNKGLL